MSRIARRVVARYLSAKSKRLRVFDFDDTLVSSEGSISVVKGNGETIKMDSATFAYYRPSPGDHQDFGDFNDVTNPRIIKKNFDKLKEAVEAGDDVVILTARAKGSQSSVTKFLESQGVKKVHVVALASSDPYDKARWIDHAIETKGYHDVEFRDDSKGNSNAVAESASKHKKIKFSSMNVPAPSSDKEYAGPPIKQRFKSDSPTHAVVPYNPPADSPQKPSSSNWWDNQTPDFKHNYCREHTKSKYCH